ncbi:Protein of unknown function [Geodermatophilus amargosae]|uniref:DUF4244 domain-containing protein n=1 Tax=Geodermatophilus amargosae TaxID=1296565 RepID=A0A1I6XDJ9_9ACTN|nr:DUF4244 domain-containing protein [Geodermatophilus amargosae]SFT36193.1 Protein of unknown function [Geodermatophilus amargosae]
MTADPVTADHPTADHPTAEHPTAEAPTTGAPSAGRSGRLSGRWARVRATAEAGMSTAEYAVGTVAACAFAAVLYRVVTGGSVVTALGDLVDSALGVLS